MMNLHNTSRRGIIVWVLAALLGSGCGGPGGVAPASQTPTLPVATALTPQSTPSRSPDPTSEPTETPPPAKTTAPAATVSPTETLQPGLTPTPTEPLTDRAAFVADVTVPDGSPYPINTAFVKTWRLKNVGTATWTTGYALVFAKGEPLTTTTEVPLPAAVEPGQTIDLTLDLIAPAKTGRVLGFWQLRNAAGKLFGIGPNANEPIYVDIIAVTDVVAGGPPIQVNGVTLSIAAAAVSAPCPYDVSLNGTLGINANGTGRVTAQLEATSADLGFKFTAPGLAEFHFLGFEPNPFPFAYTLTFVGDVNVEFRMHVLTPTDMVSAPVAFSLTCTSSSPPAATATPAP